MYDPVPSCPLEFAPKHFTLPSLSSNTRHIGESASRSSHPCRPGAPAMASASSVSKCVSSERAHEVDDVVVVASSPSPARETTRDDARDRPRRFAPAAARERATRATQARWARMSLETFVATMNDAHRECATRRTARRARTARTDGKIGVASFRVVVDARAASARARARGASTTGRRRNRARAMTTTTRARGEDGDGAREERVRWRANDDEASASALARACARIEESGGGTTRVRSSDGFATAMSLWKVYDVVASVAPTSEVVPVFDARGGSASAASRADADAGDAGDAPSEDEETRGDDDDVGRAARERARHWSEMDASSPPSSSYDFARDGEKDSVSVGGTFDRLHAGHRLLLATAMRLTKPGGTLYVGVMSTEMLKSKVHAELVESYATRAESACAFLAACDPASSVNVRVGPLDNAPPLAATVRDMSALVVSRETVTGAESLNDMRRSAGFDPLTLVVVDVVGASSARSKLSSTALRARDAARRASTTD